jgi:hypothetical protein
MKLTKIIASAFIMMAVATASFAQTADEIVAKHIEAIGGAEKWKAIKTIEMNMKTSVQGMDVEIKSIVALDKGMKSVVSVMGQEIVTGVDGDTGWNIRPAMMGGTGEAEDMPGSLVKESKKQMMIGGGLLNYKESGSSVELVGKEKLDGAEVYNIKLTNKSGEVTNYYISVTTNFILKSAGKIKAQGQETDNEVTYSNFKQVDGLTFPFTREQPNPQMGGMMTVETDSIKLNPTIDADFFKKPAKK